MKVNLWDRAWKPFFISWDEWVFTIKATSSWIDKNKLNLDWVEEIPYITRTDVNNWINFFIPKNQSEKYGINPWNVITIWLDTQTVFYQPSKFYTWQNIQVLSWKILNKWISLFIIALLKIQLKKFNWWWNGATLGRLSRTKILLPADHLWNPDYKFMEDFIKEREKSKREKYRKYVENKLKTLGKNWDFRERVIK